MEQERMFLNGKIVYLKPLDEAFYERKYLSWVNNDEIIDSLGTLFFPTTEESLLNYIRKYSNSSDTALFAITLKQNNEFIGTAKIGPVNWIHRTAKFGRMIGDKKHRGKGIGTEVVKLLMRYAFDRLNLHWIGVNLIPENIGSIISNEKAGLKKISVIPNQIWHKGRYTDNITMGITAEEYYQLKISED